MIDGVAAYLDVLKGSYLTVATRSPTAPAGTTFATGGRVVTDQVTLSAAAQAFLNQRAAVDPTAVDELNDPRRSGFLTVDFAGQDFAGNDLTGAVLDSADLRNTRFANAVLRNATLRNADVTGADFRGADLRGANLAGAVGLTAEQLIAARLDVTTILPVGVVLE